MLPSEFLQIFLKIVAFLRFFFRTTVEQINNEIIALDTRIKKIKKQVDLPTTETDIKLQMAEFLLVCFFKEFLKFKFKLKNLFLGCRTRCRLVTKFNERAGYRSNPTF